MIDENLPRIYTSFAEFEREELGRLGLDAWPASPALPAAAALVAVPKKPATKLVAPAASQPVTPASLRAEGILEMGCAQGTSVLFVRTVVKLHLLHATWLPDRQLDDYAVNLAVTWIEDHGLPSYEVAKNLGVSGPVLQRALAAAGFERLSQEERDQRAGARAARKPGRRGRLVRTNKTAGVHV